MANETEETVRVAVGQVWRLKPTCEAFSDATVLDIVNGMAKLGRPYMYASPMGNPMTMVEVYEATTERLLQTHECVRAGAHFKVS